MRLMRIIGSFVVTILLPVLAFSCPEIAGKWTCYEKSMDYKYGENFIVKKNENIWTYTQILTDQAGEQPTYDKISDNIERLVSHRVCVGAKAILFEIPIASFNKKMA